MDLGAYAQIASLSEIATQNNINVPRLRGYRLMSDENPVSKDEIQDMITAAKKDVYHDACVSVPAFTPLSDTHEYSQKTNCRRAKYLKGDGTLRWDLVHGKARKRIKLAVKQRSRAIQHQYAVWNKYAGKENILYIHARIGGDNWGYYGGSSIEQQPWFLEKVDDNFDGTYCDIYAKIDVPHIETE